MPLCRFSFVSGFVVVCVPDMKHVAIAVLPLLTVWFGYSEEARLATIVFAALFSVTINVSDGARSVPPECWCHSWMVGPP